MRRLVKLPGIKLSDILMRLDDSEHNIYALASSASNGWGELLTWRPAMTFRHQAENARHTLSQLEKFAKEQRTKDRLVTGYLSYDFGCLLHNVVLETKNDVSTPLVLATSFDNWITFDKDGLTINAADPLFVGEVMKIIKRPARRLPTKPYKKVLTPTRSRAWYGQAYKRIKDYISSGDIYQVNLAHRLEGRTNSSGRDLFCILSRTSQADFQAYIEDDDFEVLSFSPERFIRVRDGSIETSPIKGTRARGVSAVQDEALRTDLLTNPKDQAELNMITDLMRNDLGAICSIGSIKVAQKRIITGYPTLWHAHSTIQGKLKPGLSPLGALAALMPGGSITGCPKKRAMEIIDEIEVQRRGIYTGSIFSIKPDGELDSNIAIRTIIKKADHLYLSVGGGIVYDSTEEAEYKETIDKAASFTKIDF